MDFTKVFFLIVVIYLAISLPLYLLNQNVSRSCLLVCESKGFDVVISGVVDDKGIFCRCLDSIVRHERLIWAEKNEVGEWVEVFAQEKLKEGFIDIIE